MRYRLGLLALAFCVGDRRAGAEPEVLGVRDVGIFPDLDGKVRLSLPALERERVHFTIDPAHGVLLLYEGGRPVKAYPTGGPATFSLGEDHPAGLRPVDAAELAPYAGRPARVLARGEEPPPGDRDHDGIPDPLDVLVGGKKVALNGASYVSGYVEMGYPNGDVGRSTGVCTDVVVRAVRNAGLDLQRALHEDIQRAPRAYPMVKRPDPSIDQRRVGTLLPYFRRHWERHGVDPADRADPFLPGDVIFMDTMPGRRGADHIGVVSDSLGASGYPLVINNWTTGYSESEMDLLGFVPVLERYRMH